MRRLFFNQLRLITLTGLGVLILTALTAGALLLGRAHPSQSQLAYIAQPDPMSDLYTIYLHDVRIGVRIPLISNYLGWGASLAWSPDGTQLAFSAFEQGAVRRNIYMLTLPDLTIAQITGNTVITDHNSPSWSPDGTQLAYHAVTPNTGGNIDLYIYDFATDAQERVYAGSHGDYTPRWSPDGATLAFETTGPPHFAPAVYLLDLATGQAEPINDTPADTTNPAWSPAGDALVYAAKAAFDQPFNLYVMTVDGNGVRRVTGVPGTHAMEPDWSPDGRMLAYTQFSGVRADVTRIYITPADGRGHPVAVSPYGENARQAVWRPLGKR